MNAEYALHEIATMFVGMFESMDNEYMRERASDIRDVTNRVLSHLLGVTISNPSMISEEVVIIAEDLTPSDTAQLNRKFVKRVYNRYRWSYISFSDYGSFHGNSGSCRNENSYRRY
ncbi:hypothetical protein GCM10020331_003250 [Ectobacillus funiculus]